MLNMISGLLEPSQGTVTFDGRDVTRLSPAGAQHRPGVPVPGHLRHHDGGNENLAFPLAQPRRCRRTQIAKRVGEIAEMLELSGQLNQRAAGLAADAKQKISLGRGLVRSDVSAVLFDEPLTVIDPHLKWQLRRKLKQIHHELKLTLIYVTHDQVEALTFADQVVVMTRGRAVQVGSADALFERPQHTFVGHFIGSPGMNFLAADMRRWPRCRWPEPRLALPAGRALPTGALKLGVRPEYVTLARQGEAGAMPAEVTAGPGHRHLRHAHRLGRRPAGEGPPGAGGRAPPARRQHLAAGAGRTHLLLPERGADRMSRRAAPKTNTAVRSTEVYT